MEKEVRLPFRIAIRFFVSQTLIGFITIGVVIGVVYVVFAKSSLQTHRSRAENIVHRAAAQVDVAAFQRIQDASQSESIEYETIKNALQNFAKANPEISNIYTMRPTQKRDVFQFVVDASLPIDHNNDGVIDEDEKAADVGDPYDSSASPDLKTGLYFTTSDKAVTVDKWGQWISGYSPLIDKDGASIGLIGIDLDATHYWGDLQLIRNNLLIILLLGALLSTLVGYIGVVIFRKESSEIGAQLLEREALILASPLGVLAIDEQRIIRSINPKILALFGVSIGAVMIGKKYTEVIGDVFSQLKQGVEDALKGQESTTQITNSEVQKQVLRVVFTPVKNIQYGRRVLVLAEDITAEAEAKKHLETRSEKAESKVKELNELRNKFIHIVSHQLRTPLNSIRWNIETLLGGQLGRLKIGQEEILRITHEAEVEIISRIGDMLMALDIEEGRIILHPEPTSISALARSAVQEIGPQAKMKDLTLKTIFTKSALPSIEVDPEKIRQVILRLLGNAITYSHSGQKIGITLKKANQNIRIEIKDEGIGIPSNEKEHIFTRFYRASNAQAMKPDASGLGLMLSKFFVEQHGGSIGFTSVEGKGSTFWFELPIEMKNKQKREVD